MILEWAWTGLLLLFIVAGESAHVRLHPRRGVSPIASAAVIACMLSLPQIDGLSRVGVFAIGMALVSAAVLVGSLFRPAADRASVRLDVAGRLTTAAVAGVVGQVIAGSQLGQAAQPSQRWTFALALWCAALIAACARMLVVAVLAARREGRSFQVTLVDEVSTFALISFASATTAVMIVLSRDAIGLWGPIFFMLPLALSFAAVRRYAQTRKTYRETIAALSRLTDLTGHTPTDHARRVADLSVRLAHHRGMSQREIDTIEYAALLHDLGQVGLGEPIPGGSTVLIAPRDQTRVAEDGADIIRHSGVLDAAAVVVSQQAVPFREVLEHDERIPVEARIIKLANAFEDLTGGSSDPRAVSRTIERIQLGLGYEYDPRLVDDLIAILRPPASSPAP